MNSHCGTGLANPRQSLGAKTFGGHNVYGKDRMNILSKIKPLFCRKPEVKAISSDEIGVFTQKEKNKTLLLKWEQVKRIAVYKEDEFTTDLICIEYSLAEDTLVTIHEELEGYDSVVQRMHLHFEDIEKDWYSKIVQPAFERNYRVIYEKSA